ncbi:metallophosphoesterase family protein [Candidatus Omnitrophota bacterium]
MLNCIKLAGHCGTENVCSIMRFGIFSDIHSNIEALNSVLSAYEVEGIDKYLCVGDIVGYGTDPKECIKTIRERNIATVAGNHDWATSGKFSIEHFSPYAKTAVLWTKKQIDASEADYLDNLNLIYEDADFCLVHGTLLKPECFNYLYELSDAKDTFEVMQPRLCFVGHTHSPIIFGRDSERISYVKEGHINVEPNKQYIINVGSVGQPRDGDTRACLCIYDSKEKVVQIKRVEYDIKAAQTKILNAGLPPSLANRLVVGQ